MRINYQLSKRKFGAFVIAVSLFELVGCASQYRERVNLTEIRGDCAGAESQKAYLESLRASAQAERTRAWFDISFNPWTEDRDYKTSLVNGWAIREIDEKIGALQICNWNSQKWKREKERQQKQQQQ